MVILSGAGISAESGLKTFRGDDGLWQNYRPEELATPEAFAADPELVQSFYNQRRRQLLSAAIKPNPAHFALARLEAEFNGAMTLVTQNVDNLHELAGSQNVLHMHGELLRMVCTRCGGRFDIEYDIAVGDACDKCGATASLRPDIVWFGEMPKYMDTIYSALEACELFLSIGTSGNVYPAAGFVELANKAGAHSVEINLEPSQVQSRFAEHIYGKAGEVLPGFVDELLARAG
jgi:NAD-dependent deacetylase